MASRHPDVAQHLQRAQALLGSIGISAPAPDSAPAAPITAPAERARQMRTPTPARGIPLSAGQTGQTSSPNALPGPDPCRDTVPTLPREGPERPPWPVVPASLQEPAAPSRPGAQILGGPPARPEPTSNQPGPILATIPEPALPHALGGELLGAGRGFTASAAGSDPAPAGSDPVPSPTGTSATTDADDVIERLRLRAALTHNAAEHLDVAPAGRPSRRALRGSTPRSGRPAIRWRLGGRTVVAFAIVLVAVVAMVTWRTMAAPAPAAQHLTRPEPTASAGASAAAGIVVVHVAGQVAKPGVVELPAGSRVHDAITAAGGPLEQADLSAINLARTVTDGEQILVPLPGQGPAGGTSASSGSDLVNVNTADATALQELPGIGPVLAERIVAYRTEHGPFSTLEDLQDVPGIGPGIFDKLKDQATV